MRRTANVDRLVLGGLCGGACTALLAGANHSAVEGIFVIGAPLTFSAATQRVADLPDATIEHHLGRYVRKLFQPASWARFFSLKTDYRTLIDVFATKIRRHLGRTRRSGETSKADATINMPVLEAIRTATRDRKGLLFVFGENDYLWHEFQELRPRLDGDRNSRFFELVTIPGANHILSEQTWQDSLYAAVTSWLARNPGKVHRRSA